MIYFWFVLDVVFKVLFLYYFKNFWHGKGSNLEELLKERKRFEYICVINRTQPDRMRSLVDEKLKETK